MQNTILIWKDQSGSINKKYKTKVNLIKDKSSVTGFIIYNPMTMTL